MLPMQSAAENLYSDTDDILKVTFSTFTNSCFLLQAETVSFGLAH